MKSASTVVSTMMVFALLQILPSCSTPRNTSDEATNAMDRRTFDEQRFRDPHTGVIPPNIRSRELAFVATLPGLAERKRGDAVQELSNFWQVGPVNVGGRTRAMALDVDDPSVLFAGGVSGGLWRSTNAGGSWNLVTNPTSLHSITTIAQDTREGKTNTWYYGSGEAYGNSARITGNGIWKSTDGGLQWEQLSSTASDRIPANHTFAYVWRLATDPGNQNDVVYAATALRGIQRSSDGGKTWATVLTSNSYFTDVAVTPTGVAYAVLSDFTGVRDQRASRYGVFRSENGTDWVDISPSFLPDGMSRGVIGLVPASNRLFVVANTPGAGTLGLRHLSSGILEEWHSIWSYEYLSGDGSDDGGRWEDRSDAVPLFGGRSGDMNSQGGYDLQVTVSPHDTNLVVIGAVNLYRSTNGFRGANANSWIGGTGLPDPVERYPNYPGHHADQHEFLFHPTEPGVAFSGHDGGISGTSDIGADTVRWDSLNVGYVTTQFYGIAIKDAPGDNHVVGGLQDNGTWEGVSASPLSDWVRRNGADGGFCAYADNGRTLFVTKQQGRIHRILVDSLDAEIGRTRVDPIGLKSSDYQFINQFAVDPNDERILYHAGGAMLWRNNDVTAIPMGSDDSTSVNWDSLETTRPMVGDITAVAVSHVPAHVVYVGTESGKCYRLNNAHVGQPTLIDISKGLGFGNINSITVDRRDADHVIACFSNYGVISIYESVDGGQTWSAISGNLEEDPTGGGSGPAVSWVDILPYNDDVDVLICGTSTGLFITTETHGMSTVWTHIASETIGTVPTDMVVTRYSDKRVAVGTHGRGVFFGTITDLPTQRPQTPPLILPANQARGVFPDTVLVWTSTPNAISYSLDFSSSPDFSTDRFSVDGLRDTSFAIQGLVPGPRSYHWRVTAHAAGGAGPSSDAWSFQTVVEAPEAVDPPDRALDVKGLPVELRWTHVPAAQGYDVEVSTNLAFQTIVASVQNVQDTVANINGLASGIRYFWHVRSHDVDTVGLWSKRSQFTTGVLTTVSEDAKEQLGVQPNPAADQVSVETPNASGTVVLVEMGGRIVLEQRVTMSRTTLSVSHLPAGTYLVRYRSGRDVIESKVQIE